ncbi:MAG: lysozyme inhibitor LprI family protein [Terracidiphilus sp.]
MPESVLLCHPCRLVSISYQTGDHFHAKIPVEITRTFADGTTVTQKYYTLVARDSDGREYRENRDLIPADSDREPPIISTRVYDPKTSLITTCNPEQRICRQMTFDPTQRPVDEPTGPSSDGKSVLTRENLGSKTIDGLECTGTRETRTFNVGAFGNDKPVVVTKEIWYSPQLQFNLSVMRIDPRNGTQKFEVTDLKLSDPGAEWFAMPDGYRLVSGRGIQPRPIYPAELEPLIEKSVTGMSADQLTTALQPVEAAIGAYAKAHAQAAPNDKSDAFAGQLRSRLSGDLRMLQQNSNPRLMQNQDGDARMNETFRIVVSSPCIDKTQPGDPPNIPSNADGVRAEQKAWLALRDAWAAFLAKLFPNADPASFGWMITNERENELRRLENIERNRGCVPEESIEPMLVRYVAGLTGDQLDAAVKPVDAAIGAYDKAHAEAEPKDKSDNFANQLRMRLSGELNMLQQGNSSARPQLEEADLRMKEIFREVVNSPCIDKSQPGDPPNIPLSAEGLRAEQTAWLALRDAWSAFLAKLFPNADPATFGWMITSERDGELRRLQNVERNRGCVPEESIEPMLVRYVTGLNADQLDAALKPVDAAIRAYAKARAEAEPGQQNDNYVLMLQQQLASQIQFQQRNRMPSQDDFEEADLHLNQAYRAVISSRCLAKSIPGDPPNAPRARRNSAPRRAPGSRCAMPGPASWPLFFPRPIAPRLASHSRNGAPASCSRSRT